MDQKFFMVMMKNPGTSFLRLGPMAHAHTDYGSRNFNVRNDGILSLGNVMLMINNHFSLFKLPDNLLKNQKNMLPIPWQEENSHTKI
jgi:hypothetical protein